MNSLLEKCKKKGYDVVIEKDCIVLRTSSPEEFMEFYKFCISKTQVNIGVVFLPESAKNGGAYEIKGNI